MKEFKDEEGYEWIKVKLGACLETTSAILPNWLIAIMNLLTLYFLAKRVKKAFEQNDRIISIPIRSFDVGIKTSEKLELMVSKD